MIGDIGTLVFDTTRLEFPRLRNDTTRYPRKSRLRPAGDARFRCKARSPRVGRALTRRSGTLLAFPCPQNSLLSERG